MVGGFALPAKQASNRQTDATSPIGAGRHSPREDTCDRPTVT